MPTCMMETSSKLAISEPFFIFVRQRSSLIHSPTQRHRTLLFRKDCSNWLRPHGQLLRNPNHLFPNCRLALHRGRSSKIRMQTT